MSPDSPNPTDAPTMDDVFTAHQALELARLTFQDTAQQFLLHGSTESSMLARNLSEEIPLMRVLYALWLGYGWRGAMARVATAVELAEAQLRGFVAFNEAVGCYVMTQRGATSFSRWQEMVVPFKDHPKLAPLWRAVTTLD